MVSVLSGPSWRWEASRRALLDPRIIRNELELAGFLPAHESSGRRGPPRLHVWRIHHSQINKSSSSTKGGAAWNVSPSLKQAFYPATVLLAHPHACLYELEVNLQDKRTINPSPVFSFLWFQTGITSEMLECFSLRPKEK